MPALLALMSELYAESGYELDCVQAERALLASLADERLYSQAEPCCIRASSAPPELDYRPRYRTSVPEPYPHKPRIAVDRWRRFPYELAARGA